MLESLRKIQDLDDLKGKTVIVRTNFDVPLDEFGEIRDTTRIESATKTVRYLMERGSRIVIISHLGRPNGEYQDDLSLIPSRFELGRNVDKLVKFVGVKECENSIKFMEDGDLLLLENIRFSPEEESKDPKIRQSFAKIIANYADYYVNECFGVYREHSTVYELPQLIKSVAGFHVQDEIEALSKLKESNDNPYVVVVGGKKVDTKLPLLDKIVENADQIILGGPMAYTFMKAKGIDIGKSIYDKGMVKHAKKIIKSAKKHSCDIVLPVDHVGSKNFEEDSEPELIDSQKIPKNLFGMDLGPKTLEMYGNIIESARVILWAGPMGVFEWENFSNGTHEIGEYITLSAPKEVFKVAGGGDTLLAIKMLKLKPKRFNHISVGGGMMLKFLSDEEFPVLDILTGEQTF